MKKTVASLAIISTLMFTGTALATKPDEDGEHKVGICHRTASDTNPYVYIEVDDEAAEDGENLSDHLGNNDKGHKPTFWKSDGVFRGVTHEKGDAKDDYLATSKSDCDDFSPTPEPTPELTPTPTPEPTPEPTPNPTPEVTPEPTPEVTPTPETPNTPNEPRVVETPLPTLPRTDTE